MMAEISSEKTIAKPAPEPMFSTSSTGSSARMPKAAVPSEVETPMRFHMPNHTTA